jgi:RNA polymerase sigma-70 factor (ECF subfamily)
MGGGASMVTDVLRNAGPSHALASMDRISSLPTFASVYEEHFTFVWTSARRLGVPEAFVEDAVQEVFVIVHRRLDEFEGRSSMKTWLFGILRNVTREVRRSIRRKSPHHARPDARVDPHDLVAAAEDRPDQLAERSDDNRVLHALLDRLDDDKREVFVLAELEQFSAPEIAEALGTNVNTVYSRLRHARHEFAEAAARYRARLKDGVR